MAGNRASYLLSLVPVSSVTLRKRTWRLGARGGARWLLLFTLMYTLSVVMQLSLEYYGHLAGDNPKCTSSAEEHCDLPHSYARLSVPSRVAVAASAPVLVVCRRLAVQASPTFRIRRAF